MKCPHCGNELKLNSPVIYNVEAYHNSAVAVALCCGKGVLLVPKMTYEARIYMGPNKTDDWGHLIK